jgi:hypothetical protein
MSAFVISSVASLGPTRASITLSGSPTGTLWFVVSRTPDIDSASDAPHAGTGPCWLDVPHPGLWYIWAGDDNGATSPVALWSGWATDPINEVGERLQSIIDANRLGIEARMTRYDPDLRIQQVVFGSSADIVAFPAVLVTQPRWSEQWYAMPWTRLVTASFQIACGYPHQDEAERLRLSAAIGHAVRSILNQPAYESLTDLGSGVEWAFCTTAGGEVMDVQVDENTWVGTAQLEWSGQAMLTDGG